MEKSTRKAAEKLKIIAPIKKKEDVEKALAGDIADEIPPENPDAYCN